MKFHLPKNAKEELEKLSVFAMYLFGSRAIGAEHGRSDFDFAVLTRESGHKRGDALHDAIYDILSPLCKRTLKNDVIDIVFAAHAPLELRMHIIRYGKVLLDIDPKARFDFEEQTTNLYCDYRPILDMFDRAILDSL